MKNSCLTFIIFFFCITNVNRPQRNIFSDIFQKNKEAVVLISTFNLNENPISQGTGFIVNQDGYIITNYHVIIGACSIEVKLWNGKTFSVNQFDVHESIDIALLKIEAQNLPVVKLGDIKTTGVNDSIIVISNPGGLRNISSTGKVINVVNSTFDIDAIVTHGSSGGPVFNAKGYVIGFIVAGIKNSMINKAIIINEATRLFERKKMKDFLCDSGGEIQKYFQLGINSTSEAKWNEALMYFNVVLQKQPNNLDAHLQIAKIHQERGFYQLAILRYEIIRQNMRDQSELANLFFNRGVCYSKLNLYDEAASDFQSVLTLPDESLRCKSFYNLYVAYYNLDKSDQAIKSFYRALDCAPELILPSQWSSIGECYLNLGQLDSAEVVINRTDKDLKYYSFLSKIYIQKQDTVKAIEKLKEGIEKNPSNFSLWFQLAGLYFDLKNYPEAITAYETASQIEPNNESVYYNRCAAYLNLSIQYFSENYFSKCIETLTSASKCDTLKEKVDNIKFKIFAAVGLEHYSAGNYLAAIDTLKLAIDIKRNVWSVWYNLGLAYSMNKENEEALISFTEAIALAEDSCRAKTYLRRGSIYFLVNKPWKAIEDFKNARSLPETANQISMVFLSIGEDSLKNNNYLKTIAFADSALLYDANNSDAFYIRGTVLMQLGNYQKALLDFNRIKQNSNSYEHALRIRTQIFLDIGIRNFNSAKYSTAEDTLKLALQEISKCNDSQFRLEIQPKIWNTLGLTYSEVHRYKNAIDAYSKAITLNPGYPQYWFRRAYAKYNLDDFIEARKDLQTAIKLDLQYVDAHKLYFEICIKLMDLNESCKECGTIEKLNVDDTDIPCRLRIQQKFGTLCNDKDEK